MPFAFGVLEVKLGVAMSWHPNGSRRHADVAAQRDKERRQLLAISLAVVQGCEPPAGR